MKERISNTVYFQTPGKQNTKRVFDLVKNRADELGIQSIIVATTSGKTGALASKSMDDLRVIVVTHSTGFKGPNTQELTDENRKQIEENGGIILTTTHAFGGVNRGVRKKLNTYQTDEIIAFTLRIFCEGMKVAAEMSLMAADAGLIRVDEPAILVAGTGSGADTAVVVIPTHAQTFFDLKIAEIICMPSPQHPAFQ